MTDVLVPVLVPYARLLEYCTRRLGTVTELTQPDGRRAIIVAVSSPPIASEERAIAAVRVLATDPAA